MSRITVLNIYVPWRRPRICGDDGWQRWRHSDNGQEDRMRKVFWKFIKKWN